MPQPPTSKPAAALQSNSKNLKLTEKNPLRRVSFCVHEFRMGNDSTLHHPDLSRRTIVLGTK
jgi:hypothetical protein